MNVLTCSKNDGKNGKGQGFSHTNNDEKQRNTQEEKLDWERKSNRTRKRSLTLSLESKNEIKKLNDRTIFS